MMPSNNTTNRHFSRVLLTAIRQNKNDEVVRILSLPQPNNEPSTITRTTDATLEWTLLHYAAEHGNYHIVKYLIDHGSEVDAQDKFKRTPLMLAVSSDRGMSVELLLKANANIHLADWQGKSALLMILQRRMLIDLLFQSLTFDKMMQGIAADKLALCFREAGFTLNQAVVRNDARLIKFLLKHDYDVNGMANGETALHTAVKKDHLEMVRTLVECGADVDALDSIKATPVYYVYKTENSNINNLEILRVLMSSATLLTTSNDKYRMQIHRTLLHGSREAVQLVLQSINDLNVHDKLGNTVVHYLARNSNADAIETLRGREFNVNKRNVDHYTPLHLAAFEISFHAVKFLLENKGDVDARGHSYETPLHRLFLTLKFEPQRHDARECIELLLEYGSDAQDYDVLGNFDWISRSYNEMTPRAQNGEAGRILTLVEPILTHLAVRKVIEGDAIDEYTMSKINLQRTWVKYFSDACKREVDGINRTTIYGKVTVLEFLSHNLRRVGGYTRNEELVSQLENLIAQLNSKSPYSMLLKRRLAKAQKFAELKEKATAIVCRLINCNGNAVYSVAEYIVEYLGTQDMEHLQFVWFG